MKLIVSIVRYLLKKEWFFLAVCEALCYGSMHISRNPPKGRRKEKASV